MSKARLPQRSLLDDGALPVGEISALARREALRPRDAYQSHKWFARRLAATARSLLAAAVTPADGLFWKAYYETASCEGLTVLDPFMGGGVMLLEASRLGADVVGFDVEPVAAAVSDFQERLPELPDLSEALAGLLATVGTELEPFYRAVDAEGRDERLLHAFHVQSVDCGGCGTRFRAHPSYRLAWNDRRRTEWIVCSGCGEIEQRTTKKTKHRCRCGVLTSPSIGQVRGGVAICPCCGHGEALISHARRSGRPNFELFAVETIPIGDERLFTGDERRIRAATEADRAILAAAERRLAEETASASNFLCEGGIPSAGRSDDRVVSYGYRHYHELFSDRQRLHLGLLSQKISKIDGPVGEALKIAFSDHLLTNNMLCGYAGGWRRLSPLFSIKAYRHIPRPVEINPWLRFNGRGTFPNAVRSVTRAASSLRASVEPTIDGGVRSVVWRKPGSSKIRCGDSSDLSSVPSDSIDLVLTDPPYFDYISYSELGHFFVPWMARLGLIEDRHLAGLAAGQLAATNRKRDSVEKFTEGLTRVFRECSRVAKPGARMAFTYQNLDGQGWEALGRSLLAAGIRPLECWPMLGDSGSGLQKRKTSISWDCVVLCTFDHPPATPAIDEDARAYGAVYADRWKARLAEAGHSLTEGDLANMAHAGAMLHAAGRLPYAVAGRVPCEA